MAAAEFQASGLDDLGRTIALLDAADANIRRTFLTLIGEAQGLRPLEEIIDMINTGRTYEALALIDDVGPGLNEAISAAYVAAGVSVAAALRESRVMPLIRFDSLTQRGVLQLQQSQARLVRELTAQQSSALQITLQEGLRAGLPPAQIARNLRGSIGLTGRQAQSVANYRKLLVNQSSQALNRALRNPRYDAAVARSIANKTPLTQMQIDRMVEGYERNLLAYRAQVIGSTEALAAVNAGEAEMWAQAVDRGLDGRNVEQRWHTLNDGRERDSHGYMDGQTRPLGVAFQSGNGIYLRYPGDGSAPAREVAGCRCVVSRSFLAPPV